MFTELSKLRPVSFCVGQPMRARPLSPESGATRASAAPGQTEVAAARKPSKPPSTTKASWLHFSKLFEKRPQQQLNTCGNLLGTQIIET